jgi:hypothetical protein
MKKTIRFGFFPIVSKDVPIDFPTLEMEESEIGILWALCKEGPKSIYDLNVHTQFFLQPYWPKQVWITLPDMTPEEAKEMRNNLLKPRTYHRSSIYKVVEELSKKNLTKISKDTSESRIKTIVKPTFEGIVLYLRNPFEKQKLENIWKHYSKMIPFSDKWDSIVTVFGEEKCLETLELTLKNFQVNNVRFRIKPLAIEFEGCLEGVKVLQTENEKEKFRLERNKTVADYLKSNDARILRESYIAYLALNDIKKLSFTEKRKLDATLSKLGSERELAYFENRQLSSSNSLFKGGRIKEFLQGYSGIEYFFTGMFVNNLLWDRKNVERHKEYTNEFDIEYL